MRQQPFPSFLITGITVLLFQLVFIQGKAQTTDTLSLKGTVIQDPRVEVLVMKHVRLNQMTKTIDGFRIQLYSDSGNNSKANAQAVYDEFVLKYPGMAAYLTFKSPNYKVRVGDFRSRLDAQRFLNEAMVDYPNAFIVSEPVNIQLIE